MTPNEVAGTGLKETLEKILQYTSFYEQPEDIDPSKIREWASKAVAASGGENQDELWEQAANKLFNYHNPNLIGATKELHRLMDGFKRDMKFLSSQYIIQKRKV